MAQSSSNGFEKLDKTWYEKSFLQASDSTTIWKLLESGTVWQNEKESKHLEKSQKIRDWLMYSIDYYKNFSFDIKRWVSDWNRIWNKQAYYI